MDVGDKEEVGEVLELAEEEEDSGGGLEESEDFISKSIVERVFAKRRCERNF